MRGDARRISEKHAHAIGCTEETRHFRDNHEELRALGAELVGVSVDPVKTQCAFDRRVTYILDPHGLIETVIRHEVRVYKHLDDVLRHPREHPLSAAGA